MVRTVSCRNNRISTTNINCLHHEQTRGHKLSVAAVLSRTAESRCPGGQGTGDMSRYHDVARRGSASQECCHRCLLCLALLIVATTAAVPAVPAPCVPRMRTSRSSTSDYAIAARRGPAAEAARAAAAGQWRDQLAILCWLQCGCILARVLSEAPVVSPTIALQAPAPGLATSEPSPVC